MPESVMDKVEFQLYLAHADQGEDRILIDSIKTVCASVYGKLSAFEVFSDAADNGNAENILVRPTLVRAYPAPTRYYFGDLSDPDRLHEILSEDRPPLPAAARP